MVSFTPSNFPRSDRRLDHEPRGFSGYQAATTPCSPGTSGGAQSPTLPHSLERGVRKSIFPRTDAQPGFRYSVLCRAWLVSGYIMLSLVQKKNLDIPSLRNAHFIEVLAQKSNPYLEHPNTNSSSFKPQKNCPLYICTPEGMTICKINERVSMIHATSSVPWISQW